MLHPISKRDTTAYWQNLFSDEELDQILELCKALPVEEGTIGERKVEDNVRKSNVAWLKRNSDTEWIFARYDGAVHRTNSSFFCVDIDPLQILQFTVYDDDGGHYEWHWDMCYTPEPNDTRIVRQRKISVVTQLNGPEDYDGGVIEAAPCGEIFNIERKKGLSYMFLSFVNHRVTPVTKGIRYSLVGWYEGPDWR